MCAGADVTATRDELLTRLRDLKPWLAGQGIASVRLFGSYARNEAHADTDVDLLVELAKPMGLRFFDLQDALAEKLGLDVQMTTEAALPRDVRFTALRDAVDA